MFRGKAEEVREGIHWLLFILNEDIVINCPGKV